MGVRHFAGWLVCRFAQEEIMRKVFVGFPITSDFILSPEDSRHIITVLRKRQGDCVPVTDAEGVTYECRIKKADSQQTLMEPLHRTGEKTESSGRVILAAGLLKNDKFEWVVQKATELGVSAIVPVQMAHCVVKLNDTRRKERCLRWQRIAQEAAKQCGRNDIPDVTDVLSFTEVLDTYGTMPVIIPFEKETRPLRECCAAVRTGDVVICIGPEGGFSAGEIAAASMREQCQTVSLGPRILRAETAAIASLAIIMYERGFK